MPIQNGAFGLKETSEVLARKYRPTNFNELIGQETIAQTLSLALDSNRLSHAYLFSGLRGSGKTSTARIFAKALICEKGISRMPCGICQNCILSLEGRHMDIVEMDAASNRGIDDIRDLVEQTKYKPSTARFKIFIIDEVHMLTPQAFNALLKTLEEPPSYVKFILATTDPLKIPATILSRSQHFRFKSIATTKIVDHLIYILHDKKIEYEKEALEILARSGSGSLRDTLTLLDQAIIYSKNHVDVKTVTDMLGLVDPQFIADLFSAIFAKDYAQIITFTKILQEYEAEMVLDELIAYLKDKMYNQDALFSTLVLDRFFRILSDSKYLFSINADGSFVLSLVFFKMVEALRIKEIDQMIESLQKEIQRPDIATIKIQTATPERAPKVEEISDTHPPQEELFDKLILKIKDRNSDLGECFTRYIRFISYENNLLTWESCANEECKKSLNHGYSVIKQLVRELFGFETKIKGIACSQQIEEKKNDDALEKLQQNSFDAVDLEIKSTPNPYVIAQPSMTNAQSTSMIEDAEMGGSGSCIGDVSINSQATKELNGTDITQEPMIQKAIELFEARKITVQSKI